MSIVESSNSLGTFKINTDLRSIIEELNEYKVEDKKDI